MIIIIFIILIFSTADELDEKHKCLHNCSHRVLDYHSILHSADDGFQLNELSCARVFQYYGRLGVNFDPFITNIVTQKWGEFVKGKKKRT